MGVFFLEVVLAVFFTEGLTAFFFAAFEGRLLSEAFLDIDFDPGEKRAASLSCRAVSSVLSSLSRLAMVRILLTSALAAVFDLVFMIYPFLNGGKFIDESESPRRFDFFLANS